MSMFVSWGQNGMMSPMPTRSDRDNPVKIAHVWRLPSMCRLSQKVVSISTLSQYCGRDFSGFLSPVSDPVSSMSRFAVSDLWYWCWLRLPVWLCHSFTVLCLPMPYVDLQSCGCDSHGILPCDCSLGADDCGLTLSARCHVALHYSFVCLTWYLGESAFPCPSPRDPSGHWMGLSRQRVS